MLVTDLNRTMLMASPPPVPVAPRPSEPKDCVVLGAPTAPQRQPRTAAASAASPAKAARYRVSPDDLPLNRDPFRLSHDLRVLLYPDEGKMVGDDRMTISRLPSDGRARFLLSPELRVRDVTVDGERVPFGREEEMLTVDLRGQAEEGEPVRLRVRYHGQVPGSENGPGRNGVYLYDESWWHPSHHGVHDRARLTVSVPAQWTATASAAEQSCESSDGWKTFCWETPWAGAGLTLAAATYDVTSEERNGVRYRTLLFPGSDLDGGALIDRSARVLDFFAPLFGAYPYDHLDICESNTEGAGGVPSVVLFHPSALRDEDGLDDYLAHELSHNWWAGALAGYTADGLWYEAFAEFSANLYTRGAKDSSRAVEERRATLDEWSATIGPGGATPLREAKSYEPWDEKSLVAYKKGAFVLDMLRDRLGDETFFAGMRRFVEQGRGHFVSWTDVHAAFEEAAGQDLSPFFRQWLDRGDAPSLALQEVASNAVPGGWQLEGRIQQVQEGAHYDLDVPVVVKTQDGQVFKKTVPMGDRQGTFSWTLPAPPAEVQVDPEARVFRLKSEHEIWTAGQTTPPPVTLAM